MNKLSHTAENLIGSEILKISSDVKKRQLEGQDILNLTIGDYDPKIFPIPADLNKLIVSHLQENKTNYPPASGEPKLIESVGKFINKNNGPKFENNEILITGGSRPGIYAVYQTIVDKGEFVMYPTPSWNNNHYTFLSGLSNHYHIAIETSPENNFLLTSEQIEKNLTDDLTLISLCSPQNPTGTMYDKNELEKICDIILDENERRKHIHIKPLYLMWDQIYWMLHDSNFEHVDPISLRPEMKEFTVYIDGTSKYLCGTGIRVGWVCGPSYIIDKMKSIIGHIGAWAPKAEQLAVADYLTLDVEGWISNLNKDISKRLNHIYNSINKLSNNGYPIRCINPNGGIYLSMMLDIEDGYNKLLNNGIAVVPFTAFGDKRGNWYRISVGTMSTEDLSKFDERINRLFDIFV